VIDAMDLLHSGRLDGFCLVSSDSDFTRLASRLREQGADVYGFGEQKTPESFRQACRRFIYTENLLPEAQVVAPEEGPSPKALEPPSAAISRLEQGHRANGNGGWLGGFGCGGAAPREHRLGLRPPDIRLSKAQRFGPEDWRLRYRSARGQGHAD
jgi:NYN domain